jgi:hypothetical protein
MNGEGNEEEMAEEERWFQNLLQAGRVSLLWGESPGEGDKGESHVS